MAWNWNPDGSWAGTFALDVTLRLSRDGTSFTGEWAADNFDVSGSPIAGGHVEGVVRGTRIGF